MKVAFPVATPNELAFEFSKSTHIGICNLKDGSTFLIPTHSDILSDESTELAKLLVSRHVSCVVSPFYDFKTLRGLKESSIRVLQSQGRNLMQNIKLGLRNELPVYDVSESFIAGSCGTTCAECTLPCKG